MKAKDKFKNPPITEALISIDFELSKNISIETLGEFHKEIKSNYPTLREHRSFSFQNQLNLKQENISSSNLNTSITGYQFWDESKTSVVQVFYNKFSYNKLAPYHSWESMQEEAQRIFNLFYEKYKLTITGLVVRYINMIKMEKNSRISDYFYDSINLPEELPQKISSISSKITVPFENENSYAQINFDSQQSTNNNPQINFDIMVFKQDERINIGNAWDHISE